MRFVTIVAAVLFAILSSSCSNTMIRPFNAPDAAAPIGPYSHGVVCSGSMIFLSGQIALRPDGTMVEGAVQDQTKQVFDNIRQLLSSQGANLDNVVKATVFLKNMSDFSAMNEIYGQAFGDHRPARSAVEVARLPKDALVEIEVIACVP